MVDWTKIDWIDVGLHVVFGVCIVLLLIIGGVPGIMATLLNAAFWYVREALQHTHKGPWFWNWGWGSQMEFISPAIAGLVASFVGSEFFHNGDAG